MTKESNSNRAVYSGIKMRRRGKPMDCSAEAACSAPAPHRALLWCGVAPKVSTKPLEQMFRTRVIKMLVDEELLAEELACQKRILFSTFYSTAFLMNWKNLIP